MIRYFDQRTERPVVIHSKYVLVNTPLKSPVHSSTKALVLEGTFDMLVEEARLAHIGLHWTEVVHHYL